jgi:voltage-gated potassium channel
MKNQEYRSIKTRLIRHFAIKILGNFIFKILFTSGFILLILSAAVYYSEKDFIFYKVENGQRVEDQGNSSNIRTFQDSIWWAFVTSTTVGYGDFFPKSPAGRLFGIMLMFFGVSFVGVITGNIASFLVEKQLREERGLKDLKLKNHFIICGWKRNMAEVLYDILEKNKGFLTSEIVLINTADPEEIENLKSDGRLSEINYISGDYVDERVLHRANVKYAKKVLVLVDRMVKGSIQEIDSRTVMTIITIKSITKTAYTCAELLDSKFERYLRFSNCDEIVLSSDYNKALIANASAGSGISHVISALLNVNAEVSINTIDIPDSFIGKKYDELSRHLIDRDGSILIGILENTGNFFMRKKEAIKEAQKTPDISKLVDNLKTAKNLTPNLPVINPGHDYIIKKYCKSIIIEGRENKKARTV